MWGSEEFPDQNDVLFLLSDVSPLVMTEMRLWMEHTMK